MRVRHGHKIAIGLLGVVLVLVVLTVVSTQPGPENSVYRGKSVKDWALEATRNEPAAIDALKAMGPQAVSGLTRLVYYRDSLWRKKMWQWQLQQSFWAKLARRKVQYPDAYHYREAGARGLGLIGPAAKSAVRALAGALRDPEGRVRWEAATALGHIGEPSVPPLSRALRDRDSETRHAAAFALGEIGPAAAPAANALGECLGDTNEQVRSSALYSLSMLGAPALPALRQAREHGATNIQEAVSATLDRMYPALRADLGSVLKLAHANDPVMRGCAIETLGMIRAWNPESIETLIGGLQDPAAEVRVASAQALDRVRRKAAAAVPALTGALKDSSAQVRQAAAMTLGRMGQAAQSAVPALQQLTNDPNPAVRAAAMNALAQTAR